MTRLSFFALSIITCSASLAAGPGDMMMGPGGYGAGAGPSCPAILATAARILRH